MSSDLFSFRRPLILAPHPDDEALGCAGTIIKLNSAGAVSQVAYITSGELLHGEPSTATAAERVGEAENASRMLGCVPPRFLGIPDGQVATNLDRVVDSILTIIEETGPDLVLSPSPLDHHTDHIATASAAIRIHREHGVFSLAFYEIYSTVRFSHLVDITDVVKQKKEAISSYRTSLYEKPDIYARAILGLNAQRSLFLQTAGYYEAFWVLREPLTEGEILHWLTYGFSRG